MGYLQNRFWWETFWEMIIATREIVAMENFDNENEVKPIVE